MRNRARPRPSWTTRAPCSDRSIDQVTEPGDRRQRWQLGGQAATCPPCRRAGCPSEVTARLAVSSEKRLLTRDRALDLRPTASRCHALAAALPCRTRSACGRPARAVTCDASALGARAAAHRPLRRPPTGPTLRAWAPLQIDLSIEEPEPCAPSLDRGSSAATAVTPSLAFSSADAVHPTNG